MTRSVPTLYFDSEPLDGALSVPIFVSFARLGPDGPPKVMGVHTNCGLSVPPHVGLRGISAELLDAESMLPIARDRARAALARATVRLGERSGRMLMLPEPLTSVLAFDGVQLDRPVREVRDLPILDPWPIVTVQQSLAAFSCPGTLLRCYLHAVALRSGEP